MSKSKYFPVVFYEYNSFTNTQRHVDKIFPKGHRKEAEAYARRKEERSPFAERSYWVYDIKGSGLFDRLEFEEEIKGYERNLEEYREGYADGYKAAKKNNRRK